MEGLYNEALNTIAERLRYIFTTLKIDVKLAEPNKVFLFIPKERPFASNEAMAEFAFESMKIAGIKLHFDLEVSFMYDGNYVCSVILHGTPKSEIN